MRLTTDFIVSEVARASGVPSGVLYGRVRTKRVSQVRQVCYLLLREFLDQSFPEIGQAFSDRDHTNVVSGVRRAKALMLEGRGGVADVYLSARAAIVRAFPPDSPTCCPLCGCEVAQ